ncbi:MAG: 30S ribosomal protein S27ae [Candidatus Hydrothermarchaeales archaeon]
MSKGKYYDLEGEKLTRKKEFCSRCGPGTFMADHHNRQSCGRCGYTVWKGT